jgi:hypothetical protein
LAVYQCIAQCHTGDGRRNVISGSFGILQGILDLTHRGIVGRQDPQGIPKL